MAALATWVALWICFSSIAVPSAMDLQNGAVRLIQNGTSSLTYTTGKVEVFLDDEWASICYDSAFNTYAADVICHQLGYEAAISFSSLAMNDHLFSLDYSKRVLNSVSCSSSDYLTILQCSYKISSDDKCHQPSQLGIIINCYTTRIWDSPYVGQVRLTGGSAVTNGLLEIYCNGAWGTICKTGFGPIEALTACTQLGYNKQVSTYTGIYQGNRSLPIWLSLVDCGDKNRDCLTSCQSCPEKEDTLCTHADDVAVQCEYDTTISQRGSDITSCDYGALFAKVALGYVIGLALLLVMCILTCAVVPPLVICCLVFIGLRTATRHRNQRAIITTRSLSAHSTVWDIERCATIKLTAKRSCISVVDPSTRSTTLTPSYSAALESTHTEDTNSLADSVLTSQHRQATLHPAGRFQVPSALPHELHVEEQRNEGLEVEDGKNDFLEGGTAQAQLLNVPTQ